MRHGYTSLRCSNIHCIVYHWIGPLGLPLRNIKRIKRTSLLHVCVGMQESCPFFEVQYVCINYHGP